MTGAADLVGGRFGGLLVQVEDGDVRTFVRETERDRLADALAGSGHQRYLTCQDGPGHLRIMSLKFGSHIRGRPGFDVVGSPAELQAEVAGWPRKSTGKQSKCEERSRTRRLT